LGFHELGIRRILSSPVAVGGGTIKVAHGIMPVPAPATVRLLQGVPIRTGPVDTTELTTPTGAALLSVLCDGYGPMPDMVIDRVGYGAGTRDFPGHANLLRIVLGTDTQAAAPFPGLREEIVILTAELDDMSGQALAHAVEILRNAGALDVLLEPIQMKKDRPGVRLQVIARPEQEVALATIALRETTTLGIRAQVVRRYALKRHMVTVETPYGPIRGKAAEWGDTVLRVVPEFDDIRAAAFQAQVPLIAVLQAFARAQGGGVA
jgi:uncharacterized protein (TIGR00299 family) protein